jgi:hypothetical protein
MAEDNKPKLQKILIPPPRGGLNLHDNPLELNPIYATELTNFMPPTSVLEVRPAVERILDIKGQVRGMYSYTMGAIQTLIPDVEDPIVEWDVFALDKILIKLLTYDGNTKIYELNPRNNMVSPINYEYETRRAPSFNIDSAIFMNSLFFLDGGNEQIPYMYNEKKGLNKMAWRVKISANPDKFAYAENIDNLTMYKGYLYANEIGTLNIYYMNAQTADIDSTANWNEDTFIPQVTDMFNLNGVLQNGGEIFRMDTISNATNNSVTNYFVIISTNGEMLVYDGTSPADITNWKLVGNFRIPIPLNKFCFCKMEGDIVVATMNGIVSLRRIVFGQQSKITEALEWRLSGLFDEYSFSNITLRDFFFLQYYQTDRLLVFNVPIQVPCRLDEVKPGYKLDKGMNLILSSSAMYGPDSARYNKLFYSDLTQFIWDYIVKRGSDYRVTIWFNYSTNSYIELDFSNITETAVRASIEVKFTLSINGVKHSLFNTPSLWFLSDYEAGAYKQPYITNADTFFWNEEYLVTGDVITDNLEISSGTIYKLPINDSLEITKIDITESERPVISGASSIIDLLEPKTPPVEIDLNQSLIFSSSYNSYAFAADRYFTSFLDNYVDSATQPPLYGSVEDNPKNSEDENYDDGYRPLINNYREECVQMTFPRAVFRALDFSMMGYQFKSNNVIVDKSKWAIHEGVRATRTSEMLLTAEDEARRTAKLKLTVVNKHRIANLSTSLMGIRLVNSITSADFSYAGGFDWAANFSADSMNRTQITNPVYRFIGVMQNDLDLKVEYTGNLFTDNFSSSSGSFGYKLSFIKFFEFINVYDANLANYGDRPEYVEGLSTIYRPLRVYDTLIFDGLATGFGREDSGTMTNALGPIPTYYYDFIRTDNTPGRWLSNWDTSEASARKGYTGFNPFFTDAELNAMNGIKQTVKFTSTNMPAGSGTIPKLNYIHGWRLENMSVSTGTDNAFSHGPGFFMGGLAGADSAFVDLSNKLISNNTYPMTLNESYDGDSITETEYNFVMNNSDLYMFGAIARPAASEVVARSDSTNTDLSIVPFVNQVNIDCEYKSEQYVMNSHYGTWSKWEDINMVMAISHMDKFYFITLSDESITQDLNIKKCYLCTFNKEFNGDLNSKPIIARYKSGHSDFGVPNQKLFKKVKVYGSTPTFWGEASNKVPYRFVFETDFKANESIDYAYTSRALQPKDIGILKLSRKTLNLAEQAIYNKEYAKLGKQIRFIELPITANPATRISIGSEFSISEHNIVVYGYELYYVVVLP